jgi:hypothetical protein
MDNKNLLQEILYICNASRVTLSMPTELPSCGGTNDERQPPKNKWVTTHFLMQYV